MGPSAEAARPGRLRTRAEFLAVRRGERRRGPFFLMEVLDRQRPTEMPRVGYTVTKKQGNAVERNRIRRRLKEAVRLFAVPAMAAGHDYVIVGQRDVLTADFASLGAELKRRAGKRPQQRHAARRPQMPAENRDAGNQGNR